MNSEELQLVDKVLRGLMNPNNEQRKVFEGQLEQLMQNKPALILVLSQLLNSSQDPLVLTYSSVVLRKIVQVKDNQEVNPDWDSMANEQKEQVKQNVLLALTNCNDKLLKKKIATIVVHLCENIYVNAQWDEALQYIISGFKLVIEPKNSLTIETCVYLLSKIFGYARKQLIEGIDMFISKFHYYFEKADLNIQTLTVEAICEILSQPLDKKVTRMFKDFTFEILKTLLCCLNDSQKQINNLKLCLIAFSDICSMKPFMIKKSFSDVFILMGKIVEKKELDEENVRGVAFEVLLTLIEKYPSLITKDQEKLELLIKNLFKYAMEFEREIDEDWLTPKSLSLSNEEFIQESKVDEALSLLERLLNAIEIKKGLPLVSNLVLELLQHSTEDWRYKYLAYITIGKICIFVDEFSSISKIVTMIINDQTNANPKIRYACLYSYVQMTSIYQEAFTSEYHSTIIPSLSTLLQSELVLRVKLQICDTLQTFLEECKNSVIPQYIQIILDAVFFHFIKSDAECPRILREAILETLIQLLEKSGNDFKQYAEKCLNLLSKHLQVVLNNKDSQLMDLSPLLLDTMTHVGTFEPALLKNSALDICKILLNFQDNIKNFKGEFGDFIHSAWERIIPYIVEDHKEYIPSILESTIKVIQKPPEMSITSNPNEKIDIQSFLSDLNVSNTSEVKLDRKRIDSVNTSETEEYSAFLRILLLFLESFTENAFPYVDMIAQQAKKITSYPNVDIRELACQFYPLIIKIVHKTLAKDKLAELIKSYLNELVDLALKETERDVTAALLDSITDLLTDQNQILTQNELNALFKHLFTIFDNIESDRLALLKEEKETKTKIQLSNASPNQDEDSDDDLEEDLENIQGEINDLEEVLISYTDTIGVLFKTHRELSIEIAKKMITDVLPRYLDKTASVFERKMGLFILDDMVEHLGQTLLNQIWSNIYNILILYLDNPSCELRQAASFGLGEFVKHTTQNFEVFANGVLVALNKGLNVSSDGTKKDEYGAAQDNIVTALGKLIQYQGTHYPLKEVILLWIKHLPIIHDYAESKGMHDLLCNIIIQSPLLVLGEQFANMPRVIRILCQIVNSMKYSSEEIDKKITQILSLFNEKPEFKPFIEEAKKDCDKKVETKIKKYFP